MRVADLAYRVAPMLQRRQASIEADVLAAGQRKLSDKIERRQMHVNPTIAQQKAAAAASLGSALKPGCGGPIHKPFGASMNPAYGGYKAY